MVQLVEVQQLRGAVGGDMFCCLLTEEPPSKKESKFSFLCNSRGYVFRGEKQFPEVSFSQRIICDGRVHTQVCFPRYSTRTVRRLCWKFND